MRAEDDKLMKFQRATEFMRVPPDPWTTATLYKNMVLRLLFCSGNRREAAHWRERPEYPRLCVRFRQGIERGYRRENGLSVRMRVLGRTCMHTQRRLSSAWKTWLLRHWFKSPAKRCIVARWRAHRRTNHLPLLTTSVREQCFPRKGIFHVT
jgi:hypothetical protein